LRLAVNDAGVTAGYSLSPDGRYYAVRWSGGRIAKLPGLGGSECQARDIDNAGRIVGGCVTTAGQYKAVAWVDGALTRLPPLVVSVSPWQPRRRV